MAGSSRGAMLEALERVIREYDSPGKIARVIDHTLLSPGSGLEKALQVVEDVGKYGFHCAMLSPYHVVKVQEAARNLGVKLCSVIGFPSGFPPLAAKRAELENIASIVDEVDIVANIQALIAGDSGIVEDELTDLVEVAKSQGVRVVKVIVEAPLLDDNTLALAVKTVASARADYVKTSTGVYSKGGDPMTVLRVSHLASQYSLKVKAAGGIRTGIDALLALASGADRIGTSSGPRVIESFKRLIA